MAPKPAQHRSTCSNELLGNTCKKAMPSRVASMLVKLSDVCHLEARMIPHLASPARQLLELAYCGSEARTEGAFIVRGSMHAV